MPAVFEQLGFRFEYPENWSIDPSDEGQNDEQVVVSSPETAFWHLSKHSPNATLESLFDESLAALRSEYKEMEVEPAHECLDDYDLEGFDVRFLCLDLSSTCWLRAVQTSSATFLLICQAEDREFARVSAVFRAMLASTLRNLG